MSNLSERLIQLQSERKILKKDIASAIGVTSKQYKRYESGENEPTASVIIALAKHLNVSVDYLLGLTDNREINK